MKKMISIIILLIVIFTGYVVSQLLFKNKGIRTNDATYSLHKTPSNTEKKYLFTLQDKLITNSKKEIKDRDIKEIIPRNINDKNQENLKKKLIKLLPPQDDKIYFGAFPDFGGSEDNVSASRIEQFEMLANKKTAWAYFSQNWFNGIRYPQKEIHEIIRANTIPFIRLMPRNDEVQFKKENNFNLQNIIDGKFDRELRQWAQDAKEDYQKTNTPLLIDFAVEPNGNWFSWSGVFNGAGHLDSYGNENYPDGPEKYRDAYRHIIDIFRTEGVFHVTWFFHPDIYSVPDEEWNQPKYYYPGDDYIDWIGFSIYGPQNTGENYWDTFSDILNERYKAILNISSNKPLAILEFGVTDNHPLGQKDKWLNNAFQTILSNSYLNLKAISYWHENWEEENGSQAKIRIDSSEKSLNEFQKQSRNKKFISKLQFLMKK